MNQKGSRSLGPLGRASLRYSQRTGDIGKSYPFRGVYTPLRGTPPSRASVLRFAAQLRDMAYENI